MKKTYTLEHFSKYARTGVHHSPDLYFKFYNMFEYYPDDVRIVLFIPSDIICYFTLCQAKIEVNGRIINKGVYYPSGYDYASILHQHGAYSHVYFELAEDFLANVTNPAVQGYV